SRAWRASVSARRTSRGGTSRRGACAPRRACASRSACATALRSAASSRAAPSAVAPLDGPIRIGLMHPQKGTQTFAGLECIEAAQIAVRTLEERGVIPRGRVELLLGDVESTSAAESEARRFIAAGAQVLMGTLLSDWVPPACEIAEREG